tara:strand:- start:163 stop:471 length:309 start_codon:yes stop_codon:yes gene_type:complete
MIKLKSLLVEKQDKKMFDKIVKALKDVKFRATIHLNDEDKITIALGGNYDRKGYDVEVEKRLKKAGILKGFQLPQGIDMMADSSDIGDKDYTKAQHNIRGGV